MPKLLIIADDLTGALDTGVHFVDRGIRTVVIPGLKQLRNSYDCEVLVVNTESRHMSPTDARDAVSRAAQFGRAHGVQNYYKKVDSTLRGNIGAELAALLAACEHGRVMFIPAFPKQQRTTSSGRQYVRGVELHQTEFAHDPIDPIKSSDIAAIIHTQADVPVYSISQCQLESDANFEADGVYLFDAEDDCDLGRISTTLQQANSLKLTAGSAAFAQCLAELLPLTESELQKVHIDPPLRMLVVNGSLNPASHRQIQNASANPEFMTAPISSSALGAGSYGVRKQWIEENEQLLTPAHGINVLMLTTNSDELDRHITSDDPNGADPLGFAESMGSLVADLVSRCDFRALTVFGGDTLSAIAEALHCEYFIPVTELLPGVVLSQTKCESHDKFVISKAGGFGTDDVLVRVWESLRRLQNDRNYHG